MKRPATAIVLAILLTGCASTPTPTPTATTWDDVTITEEQVLDHYGYDNAADYEYDLNLAVLDTMTPRQLRAVCTAPLDEAITLVWDDAADEGDPTIFDAARRDTCPNN